MGHMTARLLAMRLAAEGTSVNVAKIVEEHPSLLLQQTFTLDHEVRCIYRAGAGMQQYAGRLCDALDSSHTMHVWQHI